MSVSLKTHKMLWGRAANRCAFPDCHRELVMDASETDDESLIGEGCHIVAKEPLGPRGDSPLSLEQREKYGNLILQCNIHHKLIDDQFNTYTVQILHEMKATHEDWVRSSLEGFDEVKQREDELYADYIEEWTKQADLDNWLNWSTWVFGGGETGMSKARDVEIRRLNEWIFSRIWPSRYLELEAAFENFRRVLQDFRETWATHAIERDGRLVTERFYKVRNFDHDRYHQLVRQYEFHVALVHDLMLELTRSANYVCDRIRKFIEPTFRLREGVLIVQSGMHSDMSNHSHRPEYKGEDRVLYPYKGLESFKKDRFSRDEHFGDKDTEFDI